MTLLQTRNLFSLRSTDIQQVDEGENEQKLGSLERLMHVSKREEKRNLSNVGKQKIEEGVRARESV